MHGMIASSICSLTITYFFIEYSSGRPASGSAWLYAWYDCIVHLFIDYYLFFHWIFKRETCQWQCVADMHGMIASSICSLTIPAGETFHRCVAWLFYCFMNLALFFHWLFRRVRPSNGTAWKRQSRAFHHTPSRLAKSKGIILTSIAVASTSGGIRRVRGQEARIWWRHSNIR